MGIQGLLPALKSVMNPIHVKELAGKHVAVDTYSWLHKGAFSCSRELCHGNPTQRHIEYCMHRVNLLRHHGVKPILVFDGGLLPMKAEQETKRARVRKENLERAIEHESCGNNAAAYECYQKAVDISPLIAFQLIQVLRQENVDYIVAPYEADAQMTYLSIKRHVEAVITEDSDLIPFGCLRIIFKMDKYGNGVEFQYAELARNKDLSFTSFTKEMVLEMCILSGCDYLQSLQGMGLKRAHGLIKRFKSHEKIIKHLRYSGISVPPLYEETFRKAMLTFRHQRVYDPVIENIVHLMELPSNVDCDLDFIETPMPQDLARAIARGEVDPITHERFQDEASTFKNLGQANYSTNGFLKEKQKRALELPVQKNLLTNYFCLTSAEAKRQFKAPRTMVGGLEQSEELPLPGEETGLPNIETSDFKSMLQGSTATLKRSMSGLFDDKQTFSKIFLSDYLGNDSKMCRNIGSAYECEALSEDEDIRRREHDVLEITANSVSDVTFQDVGSGKSKPLVPSRKIVGSLQTSNVPAEKVGKGVKRGNIIRSRYFCTEMTDIDMEKTAAEVLPSKEDVSEMTWDMEMVQKTVDTRHCSEKVSDNRDVGIKQQLQQDSVITNNRKGKAQQDCTITSSGKGDKLHDAIASGKGKHVPIFRSDLISSTVQQEKFACNISHIEQYSDIAEQSMERIASTISSFRYTTGRARASGLRAPSKSATTSKSVRDLDQTSDSQVDFSKFAYKSNKNRSQQVSHT
ncbi:hypothetical protein SUGI_0820140 [Cryptomeria japonica]|uniref:exonuclease 1 isoform X1 n=1 Tax=Cryptomeria japonica TaxID=3369 RepID=UPI0024146EB0|nr:exonuclease 1 isoform X1 [Cryptomeria japonica]GLJ40054.1 hypothetical protein SUGI_0820140 [Cryptomeria japonica]